MMTQVKKNYASIMEVQEGNMVPYEKQLDVKGIECMHKSSTPLSTRNSLKKILLEDILRAPAIDQLRFIKDIAILERQITDSLKSGSKEYYKPVTIKAKSSYDDPMRIQGVKASFAWNLLKSEDLPAINLDERNAVDIVKVRIDKSSVDRIKDKYPEIYENAIKALELKDLKNKTVRGETKTVEDYVFNESIDAIAIPMDTDVPEWIFEFINYTEIINNNIGGFPTESIGVQRMDKKSVNYTNIIKL